MKTIKNISSIDCAKYCNGRKAIRIVETTNTKKAYVQYADGMQVWKFNDKRNLWEMISEVTCANC